MKRSRLLFVLLIAVAAVLIPFSVSAQTCNPFYSWNIDFSFSGSGCYTYSGTCALSSPVTFTPVLYSHPLQSCDTLTWDFGDGSPVVAQTDLSTVSHTYTKAGSFKVTLTGSNTNGSAFSQRYVAAANGWINFYNSYTYVSEAGGSAQLAVSRTNSAGTATINYATSDGTAVAGVRYTATSGTLTFNDGELTKSIGVPLINDTIYEGTQYFNVTLSNPTGGYILGSSSTEQVNVNDDDPPPTLGFAPNLKANEADGVANITVLRTGDMTRSVSVTWSDPYYGTQPVLVPGSGVLTFNPGETSKSFQIGIVKDGIFTGPRSAEVDLNNPTNGAYIQNGYAYVTITDAEQPPTISASDASIVEGDSGQKTVSFTITLSAPLNWAQYVNWTTKDGTARAGRDYAATGGSLFFATGQTSQNVSVSIIGNTLAEQNKTFQIVPSTYQYACCGPTGITYPVHAGTCTILNDDINFIPRTQSIATGSHAALTLNVGQPVTSDYVIPVTTTDATVAKAPSSVTLHSGSALASIDVTGVAHGTATITVTLPAALGGGTFPAGIAVYDGASLIFNPPAVHAIVGATTPVSVSMSPAQAGPVLIPLQSSNTAFATVPTSVTIPPGGSASFNVTGVALGSTIVGAILPPQNGGATVDLPVDVSDAPKGISITSIAPSSGPVAGGTAVTVTGANFGNTCTLMFDGAPATGVSTTSTTTLAATTPAHVAGSVDVTVNCGADTFTIPSGFTFVSTTQTVSSITPSFGSTHGGTLTSISGGNFQNNCWAFFDDLPAHNASVLNATTILATTPAHAEGAVPVSVRCGGSSVSLGGAFTFANGDDPSPVIASVDPLSGSAGQSVDLTGVRFRTTDRVTFDSTPATILATTPDTHTVRVPELPLGKASITLMDVSGHVTTTGPIFTILEPQPPHIDSVTPTTVSAGDELDLTGSGFRPAYSFVIGGKPAPVVELSYTHAIVRLGAVDAGKYPIEVHNAAGDTAAIGPTITCVAGGVNANAVAPLCGSSDGGVDVTITGNGFATGAAVAFAGVGASEVTVVDAHTITAKAPAGTAGFSRIVVTNPDGTSGSLSDAFRYYSPMDPDGGCTAPSRRRPSH